MTNQSNNSWTSTSTKQSVQTNKNNNKDALADLIRSPPTSNVFRFHAREVGGKTTVSSSSIDWSDLAQIVDYSISRHDNNNRKGFQSSSSSSSSSAKVPPRAPLYIQQQSSFEYYYSNMDGGEEKKEEPEYDCSCQSSNYLSQQRALSATFPPATAAAAAIVLRTTPGNKKGVSFSSELQIRNHYITLGENPPYRKGAMALTCDWERCGDDEIHDFETFEEKSLKRRQSALYVKKSVRTERLLATLGLETLEQLIKEEDAKINDSLFAICCGGNQSLSSDKQLCSLAPLQKVLSFLKQFSRSDNFVQIEG